MNIHIQQCWAALFRDAGQAFRNTSATPSQESVSHIPCGGDIYQHPLKICQSVTSLTFNGYVLFCFLPKERPLTIFFVELQMQEVLHASVFCAVLSLSHIPSFKYSQVQNEKKKKGKIKSLNLLPVNTHAIEKELHGLSFPAGMEQLYCSSDFLRASFSLLFPVFIYHANCCLEKHKEKYYTSHDQLVLRRKVLL